MTGVRGLLPDMPRLERRASLWVLGGAAVALVATLAVDAAAALLAPAPSATLPTPNALLAAKAVDAGIVAIVAALLVRRLSLAPAALGLRSLPLAGMLGWSCAATVALYGVLFASAIALVFVQLLGGAEWLVEDAGRRLPLLSALVDVPGWQASALLVAVALHEELLFRALLMPAIRAWGGWVPALLLSAVVFGLLHVEQGWVGIAQASGLGLVLGGVFLVSGSIWPAVLAHFAFNRIQFALIAWLLPHLERLGGLPMP